MRMFLLLINALAKKARPVPTAAIVSARADALAQKVVTIGVDIAMARNNAEEVVGGRDAVLHHA